jgi:hypothetical protein
MAKRSKPERTEPIEPAELMQGEPAKYHGDKLLRSASGGSDKAGATGKRASGGKAERSQAKKAQG